MENYTFEFQAPQYFDFYCTLGNNITDNSYFGSGKENTISNSSEILPTNDKSNVNSPDSSDHFLELVTGERRFSYRRSSVLCEKQEDISYVLKGALTNVIDNIIASPTSNNNSAQHKSLIKQKPFNEEAYLFNAKSNRKTAKKKKIDLKQIVEDEGRNVKDLADNSYKGLASTKNYNRNTVVIPFSFQARNEEMLQRKQQKLLEIQEKKNICREFHARPVPSYILASPQNKMKKVITKEQTDERNLNPTIGTEVLDSAPTRKPTLTAKHISLHTERRARERKTFSK